MQLLERLHECICRDPERPACHIRGTTHTYADLCRRVEHLRAVIRRDTGIEEHIIGLVANDDFDTYCSILAIWLEGKAYMPLSPDAPLERNRGIVEEAGLSSIIDTGVSGVWKAYALPSLMDESLNGIPDPPTPAPADRIAYLLFTSGTTGKPKGVPITYGNLSSYVNAFERTGIVVGPEDRVLQMFELVFDVSVSTILMAFLNGACLYPLSGVRMKYIQIHELLHDHDITVAFLVPSILNYLRPYFDEIRVESLRTCMFAGEALNHHVVSEWQSCAPGARLYNLYGPTEATIVCMAYECSGNLPVKSHNGTISIGKAMSGMLSIVVDDDGRPLPPGQTGHLYLSGPQVTHGYWKRQDINRELFVDVSWNGVPTRFYKSGDLCLVDDDGDFFYLGRSDHQVKVGGFRVELGEVEFHCRALIGKRNAVAVVLSDSKGNTELRLVVESEPFDTGGMLEELRSKVPPYMVPRQVHFLNPFPMNINGKTDRGAIVLQIREVGL